jgi:hypothetical protein
VSNEQIGAILAALAAGQNSSLNTVSPDELRRGIADYFRAQEPAPQALYAPGLPANMPETQKQSVTDLFESGAMAKRADQVTAAERDHLAARINEVLRGLNR